MGDLEKDGYKSNEIVIGGFSQGGAMALQAALRYRGTSLIRNRPLPLGPPQGPRHMIYDMCSVFVI